MSRTWFVNDGEVILVLSTRLLTSLEKIFPDQQPPAPPHHHGSMLKNEQYSFQLAYFAPQQIWEEVYLEVTSPLADHIQVYTVGLIPVELPIRFPHDENVLRTTPGLYPDLLTPLEPDAQIPVLPQQWRGIWITVTNPSTFGGQTSPIALSLKKRTGEILAKETFQLEVLDLNLPSQKLIHTEWLHTDCLATWYGVEVFSEEYWERTEQYIKMAVDHGVNMILTPLFTPPLDTAVGGERPTVQLVDVTKTPESYLFGFEKLGRWVTICNNLGVRYFEFSHLFTQWGAKHAPKIVAKVAGEVTKIFGWETDATGPEYQAFLEAFLTQLVSFIKDNHLEERIFFHVSDEPSLQDLEAYQSASEIMYKHLGEFPVMDALSDYEFYSTGALKNPIPATDHMEPFLENGVPNLWTYYCSGQSLDVSQRFFSMPSARNRILGLQLYKFQIVGFLHWGFNFYYSQHSREAIDPYRVTDGGYWVPAGDTFLVYPGPNGPLPSLRLKVFHEGLQDLRALQLLEEYLGRDEVLELLEEDLEIPLTFKAYPTSAEWLLAKRNQVNQLLRTYIQS